MYNCELDHGRRRRLEIRCKSAPRWSRDDEMVVLWTLFVGSGDRIKLESCRSVVCARRRPSFSSCGRGINELSTDIKEWWIKLKNTATIIFYLLQKIAGTDGRERKEETVETTSLDNLWIFVRQMLFLLQITRLLCRCEMSIIEPLCGWWRQPAWLFRTRHPSCMWSETQIKEIHFLLFTIIDHHHLQIHSCGVFLQPSRADWLCVLKDFVFYRIKRQCNWFRKCSVSCKKNSLIILSL